MTEANDYGSARFVSVLEAVLTLFEYLPMRGAMDSIQLVAEDPSRVRVVVHLAAGSLADVARAVAEWQMSLVDGHVLAERSTSGDTLRLGVTGRTDKDGPDVEVWGTLPYESDTGLALDPGERFALEVGDFARWIIDDWKPNHTTSETSGDGDGAVAP